MPTVTKCFRPVFGKRIRVVKLNDVGELPASATEDAVLVTDGFVTATISTEVEEGTEIIQKKADGSLCVNERQSDSFKRLMLEIQLCGVNPSLLSMISNADVYLDHQNVASGFTVAEGPIEEKFSLEMWTGLSGGEKGSGYMLLPYLNGGTFGDLTVENENAVNFTIQNAFTKGGNSWGVGPFDVMEGPGTDEVQSVSITGSPTGGDFTLTFQNETTAAIPYNATALEVETALESLSVIGDGNVAATGGPLPGSAVTVTFQNALGAENVAEMTATGNFTGGTTPAVAVSTTTEGAAGVASPLPTALDPLDHLLVLLTEVVAPTGDCSPISMP